MKILAFSDLHCDLEAATRLVEAAKDADLVIGAGDFAQMHQGLEETMEELEPIVDRSIFIPGNNETFDALRSSTGALVVHNERLDLDGLSIACIGCAIPPLPPTEWNSYDMTEVQAEEVLANMEPADILITHSPPKGLVDLHERLGHLGSVAVRGWIKDNQPKLVFCGHVHDCWGQSAEIENSKIYNLGPIVNWFEL